MAEGNAVLQKMLDRLMAGLLNGPGLNCRPHNSRQRIDLTAFARLQDLEPATIIDQLLGSSRKVKITARVSQPRNLDLFASQGEEDPNGAAADETVETTDAERLARQWRDQQAVLTKLRTITEDAKTHEQDTGVHVLSVGFPLLQLPAGTLGRAGAGRRVLAPIAFIPVSITLKRGVTQSVEVSCHGDGVDLVSPNVALLAWLKQQLRTQGEPNLFADESAGKPWAEIAEIVRYVATALGSTDIQSSAVTKAAR